jgi:hypothetical protein
LIKPHELLTGCSGRRSSRADGGRGLRTNSFRRADATDTLQVTVSTDTGTLAMPTQTGLTLAYGNTWSGGIAAGSRRRACS